MKKYLFFEAFTFDTSMIQLLQNSSQQNESDLSSKTGLSLKHFTYRRQNFPQAKLENKSYPKCLYLISGAVASGGHLLLSATSEVREWKPGRSYVDLLQ